MIRYFEVLGLFDEVEYFGFMDTSTDRIVELDGEQFFGNYGEFKLYSNCDDWERCLNLIPERVKRV